jgi:hypothetical protein
MVGYLVALGAEYSEQYKELSALQSYDEELTKQRFTREAEKRATQNADSERTHEAPPASARASDMLREPTAFPVLHDLCSRGPHYLEHFVEPCYRILAELRAASASEGVWQPVQDGARENWPMEGELAEWVRLTATEVGNAGATGASQSAVAPDSPAAASTPDTT